MNIDDLWIKYMETKDKKLKKLLIENYIELVKVVSGRMYNFYGSQVEYDDILGYGVLGLIDSIDRFDLSKNVKFETYAQIRIRGEIIDNIRKLDWIPRSLRKKSKDLQDAISKLENKLGKTPSNEELANYLKVSLEEIESTLSDISTFNITSLEETILENGDYNFAEGQSSNTPEDLYEQKEMKKILAESISKLDENEQKVISLYYYEELTYREIGYILNLSESRISQIHSKSILKIKNILTKKGIDKDFRG